MNNEDKEYLEAFGKGIIKGLVGNVPEKVYENGFSPVIKQLGITFGTFGEVVNSVLFPLKFGVEEVKFLQQKQQLRLSNNLLKYSERVKHIPEEKIIEVPTEILIPILEDFTIISNEELSNAFVNLLTKASSSDTANLAHPSFIRVLRSLSADEAKCLKYISNNNYLPLIIVTYRISYDLNNDAATDNVGIINNYNDLKETLNLDYNFDVKFFFENLKLLGLIQTLINQKESTGLEIEEIEEMKEKLKNDYNSNGGDTTFSNNKKIPKSKIIKNGKIFGISISHIVPTLYGKMFMDACIK